MNCREFADFLIDYLDGNLPAEEATAFEQHLRLCPPCIHYLESYKSCVQVTKRCICDDEEVPAHVPEELINAILATRKRI